MTGPEHYREAEILLGYADSTSTNYDDTNPAAALLFAQAQVHATLALAAATIAAPFVGEGGSTETVPEPETEGCSYFSSEYNRRCIEDKGHTGQHMFPVPNRLFGGASND